MEMKTKTKTAEKLCALMLLLFLLLLLSALGGEARICRQESGRFKGFCVSDHNCNNVCVAEGFEGGDCEGHLNRRCICIKHCSITPQPESTTTAATLP